MAGAAVVPDDEVADPPNMTINEFRLFGMIEHRVEQFVALRCRHVDDLYGHQAIDVDRLAAGLVMGAEYRMDGLSEGFDGFAGVAPDGGAVIIMIERLMPIEFCPDRLIEGVVGRIAAGEQRVAAAIGDFDRI